MFRNQAGPAAMVGLMRGDCREEMACVGWRAGVLAEVMKGGYEH
jgi:hypothetical protein